MYPAIFLLINYKMVKIQNSSLDFCIAYNYLLTDLQIVDIILKVYLCAPRLSWIGTSYKKVKNKFTYEYNKIKVPFTRYLKP